MKKELRQKLIDYEVFVADDGQEFDNEKDCIHHEKLVSGERKVCPLCDGEGYILEKEKTEDYHTGAPDWTLISCKCKMCGGKGYLEKTTVWK